MCPARYALYPSVAKAISFSCFSSGGSTVTEARHLATRRSLVWPTLTMETLTIAHPVLGTVAAQQSQWLSCQWKPYTRHSDVYWHSNFCIWTAVFVSLSSYKLNLLATVFLFSMENAFTLLFNQILEPTAPSQCYTLCLSVQHCVCMYVCVCTRNE